MKISKIIKKYIRQNENEKETKIKILCNVYKIIVFELIKKTY